MKNLVRQASCHVSHWAKLFFTTCLLVSIIPHAGCDSGPGYNADASLAPLMDSGVEGTVFFTNAENGLVRIEADVTGLSPGKHGFHVHEVGDCSAADGSSAGGHFNPKMSEHGAPGTGAHHPGDLGNLVADENGRATFSLETDALSVTGGDTNIVGRALIVHEKEDDFGQPTGNAGGRIACGVIQVIDAD